MRLVVVLAGTFGFGSALLGSLLWGKPIEFCMMNGVISALGAAVLLRWWMRIWIHSLEQVSRENEMSSTLEQMQGDDESGGTPTST